MLTVCQGFLPRDAIRRARHCYSKSSVCICLSM